MKNLILFIGVVFTTTLFVSCGNSKRVLTNVSNYPQPVVNNDVADSTKVPGYNAKQRAFYWYLMSLPEKEKNEWTKGSYSENELNNLIDTIDYKKSIN